MRNIHIFKTDKLTRLHGYAYGELGLSKKHLPWKEGRNIYITNDEEIQEGDCFIGDNINLRKCTLNNAGNINFKGGWYSGSTNCRKIILTTDIDLIKNGVQSIDDEFLEWFVKNPSCEEVEVESNKCLVKRGQCSCSYQDIDCQCLGYKIVIPKEEQKELRRKLFTLIKSLEEEDKKETLEEVAERILANNIDGLRDALKDDDLFYFYKGVIQSYGEAMAKWQQEQYENKYSEEDVIEFALFLEIHLPMKPRKTHRQLLEQFKKK